MISLLCLQIAKPPWRAVCGDSDTLKGTPAAPLLPERAEKEQSPLCEESGHLGGRREEIGMLSFFRGPGAGTGVAHLFAYLIL